MKESKARTIQILEGDSSSHSSNQSSCPLLSSFSNRHYSQGKSIIGGESIEGCLGGDDGEDPSRGKSETLYSWPIVEKKKEPKVFSRDWDLPEPWRYGGWQLCTNSILGSCLIS